MESFAVLELEEGGYGLGHGPFESRAEAPRDGVAFYVNDFQLSDSRPWKIPASFEVVEDLGSIAVGEDAPVVDWASPERGGFDIAFHEVQDEIASGRAQKLVPVVTEQGRLESGKLSALVRRLGRPEPGVWSYACNIDEAVFAGATPEHLLGLGPAGIETVALAGTVKKGAEASFAEDPKEIREHELVAEYLEERLSAFGGVSRGERRLLELQGMTHFLTPVRASLTRPTSIDRLIEWLHPTPAVGHLPREPGLLAHLRRMRERLDCPRYFGAPFGLFRDGEFESVVLIRGLFRSGEGISLPSGCGVIAESNPDKEWAELALKRAAVKSYFEI